jgi:crotonobetainyl-CoA:carnitine CoA-transferase CaiB-like acyl-CoA transferase
LILKNTVVNRNKRGSALDLKTSGGKQIALRLVKDMDVFLESFVPGVLDGMGLGYDDVRKVNPGIIYCSVSGYGRTGPYRNRRGYNACAQAEAGTM